jgi:hypothetical protein
MSGIFALAIEHPGNFSIHDQGNSKLRARAGNCFDITAVFAHVRHADGTFFLRRDPRVSLAIIDPENPYRYLEVRGRVVEFTEQGADAHIDKLAKKYLGVDKYPYRQASEVRVIYKIQPEHTTMMG